MDMSILQRVFHFNSLYSSSLLHLCWSNLDTFWNLCSTYVRQVHLSSNEKLEFYISIALHKFATQVVLGHQARFDQAPSNLAKKIITPNSSLRKQPSLLKYYTKIRLVMEQAPTTETPQFHGDYHKGNTIHHY